jgi:hypothetical protein
LRRRYSAKTPYPPELFGFRTISSMNNGEMGKRNHTFYATPSVGSILPQTLRKERQKMVPATSHLFCNRKP